MFVRDVVDLDAAATLAAAAELHALTNQLATDQLRLAQHFADLNPDPATIPGHQTLPGGERGIIHGGPGCPAIAEFATAEYGAVTNRTAGSAARYIGQAQALRYRLPRTWAQVLSGHATAWKACQAATACMNLSERAVALVDQRIAAIIDTIGPIRLANIIRAAFWEADPEAAQAEAEAKAKERGVWPGRTDEHGTTRLFVMAATGDIIRLDTTITHLANALADLGDTDSLDARRARAIGILADPALAHELLTLTHHLTIGEDGTAATPAPTSTAAGGVSADPNTAPAAGQSSTHAPAADAAPAGPPSSDDDLTADPAPSATTDRSSPANHIQTTTTPTLSPDHTGQADAVDKPDEAGQADQVVESGDASQVAEADGWCLADEPGLDDEPDRDPPHPDDPLATQPDPPGPPRQPRPSDHPGRMDPAGLDAPARAGTDAAGTDTSALAGTGTADRPRLRPLNQASSDTTDRPGMDDTALRELRAKLAAIRRTAYRTGIGATPGARRPARTTLYAHITDETLLAGGGTARVEAYGPVYAAKLAELLGHDQIVIQPVIDLNDKLAVDAYEIPLRIRERIKLTHPMEQFPYGNAETTNHTDLDHIHPYQHNGPPNQTSTDNLIPLRRYSHRVKTHAGWKVRRLPDGAVEWTTRHGYKLRVDHTGTHPTAAD